MDITEFVQVVKDGGWLILLVYFFYKEVWPIIGKKIIPAQLADIENDRSFHREMEVQRAKTLENISAAIQALAISMAQTNERIASMLSNQQLILSRQDAVFGVLTDGLGDLKIAAEKRRATDES